MDCALWNDSDSDRTSSDRMYSDYDIAIIRKLQLLTERVQDLEHKLEKRVSNDDMSVGLSVSNNSNVPNIDIQVLSGPRDPYQNSMDDEDAMGSWDDSIVERSTSFLIIPVGNDKESLLNEPQKLKQSLGFALSPTAARPALCCSDIYQETADADDSEEACCMNKTHAILSLADETTSVGVLPFFSNEMVDAKVSHTTFNANSNESDEYKDIKRHSQIDEQNVVQKTDTKISECPETRKDQAVEKVVEGISRLDTSSRERDSQSNRTFRYGYTISVAARISHQSKDGSANPSMVDTRVVNGGLSGHAGKPGKHITTERRNSNIISQNVLRKGKLNSMPPTCVVSQSTDLPMCESVCYKDLQYAGIQEVVEWNDDSARSNGNIETKYKYAERDELSANRSIKIDPVLYKRDRVDFRTRNSFNIGKQLSDESKSVVTEKRLIGKDAHDELLAVEGLISTGQDRFKGSMVTLQDREVDRTKMQITASRSSKCQASHCFGNGTDGALDPNNNTMADTGLVNNNSPTTEMALDQNNALQRNSGYHGAQRRSSIKKVRVRSLELPCTSSDDESAFIKTGDAARPVRRKPRNKGIGKIVTSSHTPTKFDIEKQLKQLIDPNEIGDLHDELAGHRPSLLAVMSPTESGYVGSSAADSPRDVWRDDCDQSSYNGGLDTPLSMSRNRPCLDSPFSSSTSVSTTNVEVSSVTVEGQQDFLLPPSPYHSMGSRSSISSSVSYVGGSDYSEITLNEETEKHPELKSYPSARLNDIFSGPSRLSLDGSPSPRLEEFLSNSIPRCIASPASSIVTSELSDSVFECQSDPCECQTGIKTEQDFRDELKSMSKYILEAREKTGPKKKPSRPVKKYFLDEEQGEMDIFGVKLQKGEHNAVPMLVKVILRLRKHFFGGIEGPSSLKSLSPRQKKKARPSNSERERKISFSPSAMLLSAVGESSASEIRDVIERNRVDVNQPSPSGKSLLHKAASSGDLHTIHTLIQYGARINLTDQDGFAPIHSALRRCHYKCAIFLIECGTDMASYTRARIQEILSINAMADVCNTNSALNTPL